MRAFAAIATFATMAFSAVVSIAPVAAAIAPYGASCVPAHQEYHLAPQNYEHPYSHDERSFLDVLAGLDIDDHSVIKAHIQAGGDADVNPLDVITQLKATIKDLRVQIADIIAAGGSDLLTVNGGDVSVEVAAQIIVDLLIKITTAIGAIIKSCGPDDKSAALAVVADIYATLAVMICDIIAISADIRAQVPALIETNIPTLLNINAGLNLDPLFAGLSIHV